MPITHSDSLTRLKLALVSFEWLELVSRKKLFLWSRFSHSGEYPQALAAPFRREVQGKRKRTRSHDDDENGEITCE